MIAASRHPRSASFLLATWLVSGAPPAVAAPVPKNWSIDYETSLESTTNLQQQAGGVTDMALRNSLEFSYYPAADADNSALFRLQALNSRYRFNPDFDSTFVIATALASRRIVDSIFGYGGYQLLYKQADPPGQATRQDNDLFAGTVFYRPLGSAALLFHGYQFDFLRAAVRETSYQGHSAYVTYRHLTQERWVNELGFRSQLRLYDTIGQMEWRNQATGESVYRINDWWNLQAEVIYLNATSSVPGFTFNSWNLAIFNRISL